MYILYNYNYNFYFSIPPPPFSFLVTCIIILLSKMTTISYRSYSYKLMKSGTLSYTNIYTTLPFDWQLFINNTTNDKLFYILAPTIPEVPLHQNCKKHSILIYITNILTLYFQLIFPMCQLQTCRWPVSHLWGSGHRSPWLMTSPYKISSVKGFSLLLSACRVQLIVSQSLSFFFFLIPFKHILCNSLISGNTFKLRDISP